MRGFEVDGYHFKASYYRTDWVNDRANWPEPHRDGGPSMAFQTVRS